MVKLRIASMIVAIAAMALSGCTTPAAPAIHGAANPPAPLPRPAVLSLDSARRTAIACARRSKLDIAAFAQCTQHQLILSADQQAVLACAVSSRESEHFAECAAPHFGVTLSRPQAITADCAMHSGGFYSRFAGCAGTAAHDGKASPRERALLKCATQAADQATRFSACSARIIVGAHAPRAQLVALDCAAQNGADYPAFLTCTGANMFNVKLNDDQTIAVQCVLAVGGVPFAAVGCMATRFATRELHRCAAQGFGGAHGCFGDDNAVIGRNGWTARTLRQVTANPNSLVHDPARLWAGTATMRSRMGDWWSGTGEFVRNSGVYWRDHAAALRQRWAGEAPPADAEKVSACTLWC